MIEALFYNVQVKTLSATRVEITLVPSKIGRWFRRRARRGIAYRARERDYKDDYGKLVRGSICWWWVATSRHVGWYVERNIEAAPMLSIEDMSVEQLLLDEPADKKGLTP